MQLLRKPPNGHMVSLTLTVLSVILLLTALPYFLYIFLGKKRILPFLMAGKAGMFSSAIWQGHWGLFLWVAAPSRARHSQEGYRWEMRTPSHLPGACWTRQRYYCLKHFFFFFFWFTQALDFETDKVHNLVINATNPEPLVSGVQYNASSRTLFKVFVTNMDEPPTFQQPVYTANVSEDIPVNTLIVKAEAYDPEGDTVR